MTRDEALDELTDQIAQSDHAILQILCDADRTDPHDDLKPLAADWLAELSEAMTRPIPDEPCCDMDGHPHMHVRPADD